MILRKLLLLPARLGGIGVINPTDLPEKDSFTVRVRFALHLRSS